jgi:hypothetical protein
MKRTIILATVTVLVVGLLSLAQSQSVVAVTAGRYKVQGNPSCADLYQATVISGPAGDPEDDTNGDGYDLESLGELFGFKIDQWDDYTFPTDGYDDYIDFTLTNGIQNGFPTEVTNGPEDANNTVSIRSADGYSVDWLASLGIDAVIVKARYANAYVYSPEAFGDTGLVAPDGQEISHIEFCYDYELDVTKDAAGSYDRTVTWDLDKSVSPDEHAGFIGESFDSTWTVTATREAVEGNYQVNGTITITNPSPTAVDFSVSDMIDGSIAATVDCGDGTANGSVDADSTTTCTYSADEADGIDGTQTSNEVTVTSNTPGVGGDTATADISFNASLIGDESITVDDDRNPSEFPTSISDSQTFTYTETFSCSTNQGDYTAGVDSDTYPNTATATGDSTDLSASADVDVICYAPVVAKDATTEWIREYGWTITKTVDPPTHSGSPGDEFTSDYEVAVARTFTDTFEAAGTIYVTNPADAPDAISVDVADAVGTYTATVDCDGSGGTSLTVAAGETDTCSYTVDLPDDETRTNTATVTFNDIDFTATATVEFGDPVVDGFPTINVTDYFNDDEAGEPLGSASGDFTFDYSRDFECPTDEDLYVDGVYTEGFPNFAEIDETGQQDDANVDVYCYMEPVGRIIVDKVTDPSGAEQRFTFNPSWGPSFELADEDTPHDSGPLSPGTYSVTETVPAGWDLTSAVCSSSNEQDQETPDDISLQGGETVICTFTNTGLPAYTFEKLINGEDADTLDDAVSVEAGDTLTFTYVLTNTGNAPITWTALTDNVFGDLTDECELPIDVPVGETASCDIQREAGSYEDGKENIGTASVEGLDDQTDPAWYQTSAPTAVTLLYFRAQGTGSAIQIDWGAAAEINMEGYYLYRGETTRFAAAEPIAFLIAEGSSSTYGYLDADVEPGTVYWYWLVSVETDGSEQRDGPVPATMAASAPVGSFRAFLPFVGRGN